VGSGASIGRGELVHDGGKQDGVVVVVVWVGATERLKGHPKLIVELLTGGGFHIGHHHQYRLGVGYGDVVCLEAVNFGVKDGEVCAGCVAPVEEGN